eukprot:3933334-Rhodomonas_salina.1
MRCPVLRQRVRLPGLDRDEREECAAYWKSGSALRTPYAMSGTDVRYGYGSKSAMSGTEVGSCFRYAMSGTDMYYGYGFAMRCPVLA